MIDKQKQSGMTMIGMMFIAIIVVFVAVVAMKLIPAYTEFLAIQKILKDIGGEAGSQNMSNAEIRERFIKRADVDNIKSISANDLRINRGSGRTVVSADYSFQTELVGNVSLLVDFSASSDSRESKMAQQLE